MRITSLKNILAVTLLACATTLMGQSTWKDIKLDLNSLLTSEEMAQGGAMSYGVVVAEDGTLTRVTADDATANAVVSGTYHSDHGWTGSQMVVAVEGSVKVGVGNCTYSAVNKAKITAANGTVVNIQTAQTCYKNDQTVSYGYYVGDATTLTITGSDYNRYFSVEKVVADYMVTYYNEAYTTADASYTEFVKTPYATGETINLPATTPNAPSAKKFSHWATADGIEVKAGDAAANLSVYPVWVDAALMISATETVVKPGDLYGITNCVTKGDNQLIDSSTEGSYVLFDVMPEVNGTYSFTSMIGTTNNNMGVTVGYINANGEFIASEKKTIENSGDWNNGSNYTWTFDLYEGNIYTFKILCHSDQRYCVNVFEMTAKKEADLTPQGYKDFAIDLTGQWLLTAAEYADKSDVEFGVVVGENGAMSRVPANSELATFVISGKYHNDHGWSPVTIKVPVNGDVKVGFGQCSYGGSTATITDEAGNIQEVAVDKTGCYSRTKSEEQITYATYSGKATTLTIKNTTYSPYISVTAISSEGGEEGDDPVVSAGWKDFAINLAESAFLEATEKDEANHPRVSLGLAVAEDGTLTRVAADDATANVVLEGCWWNSHGWSGTTATVKVEGPVKISVGGCQYGNQTVTVKNAAGDEVTSFAVGGNGCWESVQAVETIGTGYYTGEATTLTINIPSYCPYIAIEKFEEVITEATVTYSLGDVVCEGSVVPAAVKVVVGTDKVTVPANFTLYVEGKTLTGWTDGTTTYAIGEEIEPTADMTLTPVFTDNAVSLADRKDAVTIKWDFQRNNGAPTVAWEGQSGLIWVAQAVVNGETIDVKCDFSTNPGKIANANWGDWAQLNGGTTFTIPSCKGAVVSVEGYNELGTSKDGKPVLTIDGQTDYVSAKTVSYTIANTTETIDVVIGDEGSYYRYIQVVLPFVEKNYAGTVFENAEACITWPFNNATDYATVYTSTPEGAYAVISANVGDIEVVGTGTGQAVDESGAQVVFVKLQPSGSTQAVEWSVKPAKGLTFTPTKVTGYIQRFGTDSENGVTVTATLADGTSITLGNYTAPRNNKSQADDKFGKSENYTNQFVIELTEEQQATLASADGFTLSATVGVGATKQGGFSDIRIYGTVNGTVADVAKYAVTVAGNIEEAGSVSIYPVSAKYDEGTEVTLTAVEKFGYNFVNWTNAAGEEISTDSKFVWTVNADDALTANFVQVNTYELAMAIEGGANDYMISYNPAPTIVDGKQMYEEGAEVMLIAASNEILDFNSWSNGETSSEIKVVMNENVSLTAAYSADDYVVGWDFYRTGGNGRVADFYSTSDNEATQLVLINEEGTTQGWLDKSTMGANGYESMKGAAVNWKPLGEYYYQTKLNAKDFTNLQVKSQLLCNYNAYSHISLDWSLDGQTWTSAGDITMETVKVIYDLNVTLPAEADHAETLYLRWKPDLTSTVVGTTAAANDGTAISNIFVLADAVIYDDGVAPKLLSTVPAEGADNASANGRVVLNFDEKVKLNEGAKATLNGEELTLAVSGKTVTAEYKGLTYSTNYSFELTANAVSDLAGNTLADAIKIDFATMTKPTVTKALYDFIVPDDGNFKEALEAAAARADKGKRYRIFVKQGAHIIPANADNMVTGSDKKNYPDPKTYFNSPNVSIIGEGMDNTSVANTMPNDLAANPDAGKGGQANPLEGIRTSGVLYLQGNATNTYFEDITLKTNTPDATGRNVVLVDGGNKTICKDVCLWAYQDTYVSDRGQSLYYFEGGVIRGRTDFICGSGDVFFNGVDIVMCEKGGYIVAPRDNVKYGYVFKDCTLKGETADVNGNYFLGRSWTEAGETYYIDCIMDAIPNAGGWTNMASGGWTRCAEYNSTTASGTVVDLSGRVTELGGNPTNPILTAEEAAEIGNMANMFGDWDPKAATEQASAPTNVKIENSVITWDSNDYVLLWAICKDGKVVDFTTEPTYTVDDATATYSVRAANEMGGLGEATIAQDPNSIDGMTIGQEVIDVVIYTTSGVQVNELQQGVNIVRTTYANGVVKTDKVVVK